VIALPQFFASDDDSRMLEQALEEFAGLVLEIHPNAGPAQLTAVNVQFEHTEPVEIQGSAPSLPPLAARARTA